MHDVIVYTSSLKDQRPSRKLDVLLAFAEGVKSQGATVLVERNHVWHPSKLAVILGWPSPEQKGTNIRFRATVVENQRRFKQHVMAIDAGCFKFHDPDSKYLRYSINGVFYDRSEYANTNSGPERWNLISQELNLDINPWRENKGNHILMLLQRDGGWSMKGMHPVEWAQQKIQQVKALTNMPIILRPHPGKVADVRDLCDQQVSVSDSIRTPLQHDLKRARAALVFNSSSGVAAILNGVPLFVDDISSVCWNVANHDLNQLLTPSCVDRSQWIYNLAAAHWSDDEARSGAIYQKFLPYLA